jgi:hypothetical protein
VKREEKERKRKGDKTGEESSHQEISTRKQRENIKGVHHSFKKDLLRKQPPLKEYAL